MRSPPIIEQVKRITRRNLFHGIGTSGYMTFRRVDLSLIFEL